MLAALPNRYAPDFNIQFILQTDASDRGIGVVLSQKKGDLEYPIMYLSKKLSDQERKYATIEKRGFSC